MVGVMAYLGIDVQCKRGCPYVVLDTGLKPYAFGWLHSSKSIADVVKDIEQRLGPVAVGIDAPRRALESPRNYYWERGKWRYRRPSDRGFGRHCSGRCFKKKIDSTRLW